jgi:hypothetical protein
VPANRFGLLELDLVAVKGKAESVRIFTLLPQPLSEALLDAQSRLLTAYRAGDVPSAEGALAEARTAGVPGKLWHLYEERLADLGSGPVPVGWGGVLRLDSK